MSVCSFFGIYLVIIENEVPGDDRLSKLTYFPRTEQFCFYKVIIERRSGQILSGGVQKTKPSNPRKGQMEIILMLQMFDESLYSWMVRMSGVE